MIRNRGKERLKNLTEEIPPAEKCAFGIDG